MQDLNSEPSAGPDESMSAAGVPPDEFPNVWKVDTRELQQFAWAVVRSQTLSRPTIRLSIVLLALLLLGTIADLVVGFPFPRWATVIPLATIAYYTYTLVRTYSAFVSKAGDEWHAGETYSSGFGATALWIESGGSARPVYFRDVASSSVAGRAVILHLADGRNAALPLALCQPDQLALFDQA